MDGCDGGSSRWCGVGGWGLVEVDGGWWFERWWGLVVGVELGVVVGMRR